MPQSPANVNRFVLSDYYKKQLNEIAYQGEFRAETFATKFRFFFLGMIFIFRLWECFLAVLLLSSITKFPPS